MTAKVHDGTFGNDRNILYLHQYRIGSTSVTTYIYQNPSNYMGNFTVCTLHLNKTNFF